jgi:hypothetical protein
LGAISEGGTTSKPVAKRKLARLMNEGAPSPEDVDRAETFGEAAARVLEAQEKQGMASGRSLQRCRESSANAGEHGRRQQ